MAVQPWEPNHAAQFSALHGWTMSARVGSSASSFVKPTRVLVFARVFAGLGI
jgi:hypothetical protein